MDFGSRFEDGLTYSAFLDKYADADQRKRWDNFHASVTLTEPQRELLSSFVREMKVLVLAGSWCGDCVNQCPIFDHFATATDKVRIRYFDRDDNPDLATALSTCGAARVPSMLFLSEDNHVCGRYGDRTLTRYREMNAKLSGAACSTGLALPEDPVAVAVQQEWLNEFERIQWMLRTSGRLRKLHND